MLRLSKIVSRKVIPLRWFIASIALSIGICFVTLEVLHSPDLSAFTVQPTSQTLTGSVVTNPSPRNANYSIDVRLDTKQRTLIGRETLNWRNISRIDTSELQFHLYYNAWKNTESTWMRERLMGRGSRLHGRPESDWGWIDVTSVQLLGPANEPAIDLVNQAKFIAPDDGNLNDQTVLVVPLPKPIKPGETVNLVIEWTSRIPRTFARTGAIGDYFFIAQWFPKIGVLEDTGWNCHQFHAATEFFSDYGIYNVRITVPEAWIVGATGIKRNVLNNEDGTVTHHYYQEDVHDFAWTTSPDFLDLSERFEHAELPSVEMRLLLQPEHKHQASRLFQATRNTLKYFGEWYGAYPYEQITIVDPAWQSGSGGMEYPTLFTAGSRWLAPTAVSSPEGVTIHETGHQFWYGVVGNNEFEHAWLDEGLTTFSTARVLETSFAPHYHSIRLFGGFVPWVLHDVPWSREIDGNRLTGYRRDARMDKASTATYRYWPGTAGSISYDKTALWLHTLERMIGWPTLQKGMSTFFEQWKFLHPSPDDFFDVINNASNQDLTWFFKQVHDTANVFDYGIQKLSSRRIGGRGFFDKDEEPIFLENEHEALFESTVVVRRYGDGVFPVEILVEFDDGYEVREQWDGKEHWTAFTYEHETRVNKAFVDPEHILLMDINYTNNSQTLTPMAQTAATKWSLRWIVWFQDLLLTYGVFI